MDSQQGGLEQDWKTARHEMKARMRVSTNTAPSTLRTGSASEHQDMRGQTKRGSRLSLSNRWAYISLRQKMRHAPAGHEKFCYRSLVGSHLSTSRITQYRTRFCGVSTLSNKEGMSERTDRVAKDARRPLIPDAAAPFAKKSNPLGSTVLTNIGLLI